MHERVHGAPRLIFEMGQHLISRYRRTLPNPPTDLLDHLTHSRDTFGNPLSLRSEWGLKLLYSELSLPSPIDRWSVSRNMSTARACLSYGLVRSSARYQKRWPR